MAGRLTGALRQEAAISLLRFYVVTKSCSGSTEESNS